jgi:hypothetical protein
MFPASLDFLCGENILRQPQKHGVVTKFGKPQGSVKLGEFWIRAASRQDLESLAGSYFDQSGYEQAVQYFTASRASANQLAKIVGIKVTV